MQGSALDPENPLGVNDAAASASLGVDVARSVPPAKLAPMPPAPALEVGITSAIRSVHGLLREQSALGRQVEFQQTHPPSPLLMTLGPGRIPRAHSQLLGAPTGELASSLLSLSPDLKTLHSIQHLPGQ
jgi:hypothetical protein